VLVVKYTEFSDEPESSFECYWFLKILSVSSHTGKECSVWTEQTNKQLL